MTAEIVRWLPPALAVLAATAAVIAARRARRYRIEAEQIRMAEARIARFDASTTRVGPVTAPNGPAIREDPWTCCETHTADCPDPTCPARRR